MNIISYKEFTVLKKVLLVISSYVIRLYRLFLLLFRMVLDLEFPKIRIITQNEIKYIAKSKFCRIIILKNPD